MTHLRETQSSQPEVRDFKGLALFVSYSREDARIVEPVVAVLRLSGQVVFHDRDSIPAGTQWRLRIASAIEECTTMVVFWCGHAASSQEVRKEYQQAIDLGKIVVPILLDSTRMPNDLAQYQGIDLRPALGAHEEEVFVGGGKGRSRAGPWRYYLRYPSEEEVQNASQHLLERLHELDMATKKCS